MEYKEAYGAALRFLNVRFLSEEELRRKLRCREVTDDIIDEVTEKLKSERFLDDHRLAESVYRYYAQKAQYGHAYICNKLRLRFLPVPEETKAYDEVPVALALVAKKFKNRCDNEPKIIRYLQNRGFSGKAVRAALEDFVSLTDD